MAQTVKAESNGLVIEAHVLRAVGIDGQAEVQVQVEAQRLVIEPPGDTRRQRLAEDLERLMASYASLLPRLMA